ncbi:MFS transporter, UMF1 family [Roseovarius azorensis]|uniref:MFS transporter, UMF1 family n=1 Tax=Roseovarius azorensis TaxID=1287727 RepID=A0A1H7J9V5_9RHOB|nr:MFS transporter [Roseovarius azorensis]SEK71134.1 MFS transporter, UMF1 family [Roseovarius azorensis]
MAEISQRKRIWGWFFFDWASQPYHTLLVTFIFGPYFASVASDHFMTTGLSEEIADARAQTIWSWCLTVTGLIIGFGAPVMGAFADTTGRRLPWIVVFSMMYVVGATAIWWTMPDGSTLWWGLLAFGFGFIGAEYALIFINSQLPSLGTAEEVGNLSGSGFAFGYIGGVLSLAVMLLLFVEQPSGKTLVGLDPAFGLDAGAREGTRFVGPFSALWFAVFMIPYFLWVRDTGPVGHGRGVRVALGTLLRTIKGLRHRLSLSTYLGSSMFYRDALNGLYGFGGTYAILVLNWSIVSVGIFGIIGAISAALFSWVGGKADRRFGPKPVIIAAIWGLIAVCVTVVGMDRSQIFGMPLAPGSTLPDAVFFGCGVLIGGLGGTLQAASRSLMVRHTDPALPTENFGLYGLSGRATAFLAPALIGLVTALSGSARIGVSPVIFLFLIGLVLLRWVNAEGDRDRWAGAS